MYSLRIKNLRGLTDTGEVELKPLTMLVGANSSGKSTFLRVFPLIKQGINVLKKGPILWYGEDIDFGDYSSALQTGKTNIEFAIRGTFVASTDYKSSINRGEFKATLSIKSDLGDEYIDHIVIDYQDNIIELDIEPNNGIKTITINKALIPNSDSICVYSNGSAILPRLGRTAILNNKRAIIIPIDRRPKRDLIEYVNKLISDSRVSGDTIFGISSNLPLTDADKLLRYVKAIKSPTAWIKSVASWNVNTPEFLHLRNLIAFSFLPDIVNSINNSLVEYFRNSHYIAPLRATAQRYYRVQNLAVQNLDSQGQNLPLFLNNLSRSQYERFKLWMSENLGFYPELTKSEGHISVALVNTTNNQDCYNIADRGFGFSQILPILTLLWSIVFSRKTTSDKKGPIYVAIEQPELHLHPSLSKKLTDSFIGIIKSAAELGVELKLLIETHSPAIINQVGYNVAEKRISENDVSVVLFDPAYSDGELDTKVALYDENGVLVNWPMGFFN